MLYVLGTGLPRTRTGPRRFPVWTNTTAAPTSTLADYSAKGERSLGKCLLSLQASSKRLQIVNVGGNNSWNNFHLRITGIDETVYLPPWSGPSDGTNTPTTSFRTLSAYDIGKQVCRDFCPAGRYSNKWTVDASLNGLPPRAQQDSTVQGQQKARHPALPGRYSNKTGSNGSGVQKNALAP